MIFSETVSWHFFRVHCHCPTNEATGCRRKMKVSKRRATPLFDDVSRKVRVQTAVVSGSGGKRLDCKLDQNATTIVRGFLDAILRRGPSDGRRRQTKAFNPLRGDTFITHACTYDVNPKIWNQITTGAGIRFESVIV